MPTTNSKTKNGSAGRARNGSKRGSENKSGSRGSSSNRASGRAWKMERASVTVKAKPRPRSNKYSRSDTGKKPAPNARARVWVGGYVRADGTKVQGYYRST